MIWPNSHDGKYNCKSRYMFLKEESELLSSQQPSCHDKQLWMGISSMHVPQKMKNLLQRACPNAMPIKENLVRRTIIEDPWCDHCLSASENPLHAYGHARNLILPGLTRSYGVFEVQFNFRISRKLFHGLSAMDNILNSLLPRFGLFGLNRTMSDSINQHAHSIKYHKFLETC